MTFSIPRFIHNETYSPCNISSFDISFLVLYSYKFSRDVNFAVFADNMCSVKFSSSKFHSNNLAFVTCGIA